MLTDNVTLATADRPDGHLGEKEVNKREDESKYRGRNPRRGQHTSRLAPPRKHALEDVKLSPKHSPRICSSAIQNVAKNALAHDGKRLKSSKMYQCRKFEVSYEHNSL